MCFPIIPARNISQVGELVRVFVFMCASLVSPGPLAQSDDLRDDDIEIIEGEDRIVYEYRNNGVLMMIKVVPRVGRPYYMVPADGSAHYQNLDHKKKLYPQWVILEW